MDQMGAFLPLILIFGVFYILLIRPQQKKVKQHREMLNNLRRGDKIITSGGIIGSINKVGENRELQVEISEGIEVKNASLDNGLLLIELERLQPEPEIRNIKIESGNSSDNKMEHKTIDVQPD